MALSLKRAEAVRDYLVTLGIPRESIDVAGYGSTKPLVKAKGAEQQNRRAVVSLARNGREISFGVH